jgi:hypothetical protein
MKKRLSFGSVLLVVLLVILGIGEFYGGISFLSDPLQQNNTMNVPLSMLDGLFIHNFILPGLFLLIVILWLGVEILVMRSGKLFPPQIATGALGFILFGLVWLPAVRKNYQK